MLRYYYINKFCVMMFPPLGPALYCLFVYSRSKVLDGTPKN
jgi:hypothetical protein